MPGACCIVALPVQRSAAKTNNSRKPKWEDNCGYSNQLQWCPDSLANTILTIFWEVNVQLSFLVDILKKKKKKSSTKH